MVIWNLWTEIRFNTDVSDPIQLNQLLIHSVVNLNENENILAIQINFIFHHYHD